MYVESRIKEIITQSGKKKESDIMAHFQAKHYGRYNPILVRKKAKEMFKK